MLHFDTSLRHRELIEIIHRTNCYVWNQLCYVWNGLMYRPHCTIPKQYSALIQYIRT